MLVVIVACAACGSSGKSAEVVVAEAPEVELTTTAASEIEATTTAEEETATAPTTITAPPSGDGPVEFVADAGALIPGVTYLTTTDVPFRFSVAESDASWWRVVAEEWSVLMVFAIPDERGDLDGAQLNLGVAEPGATRESVVAAMTASAEPLNYQASEGLFGGRDATILDGSYDDPVRPSPASILTGDNSTISVVFETGRSYRSHVFEEDGRVFIVSVEADHSGMAVVLAEAASIFESLEIGGVE